MQGRLLPRYKNRFQAFPKDYWQAEFHVARELGLGHIEFILDINDCLENPLMHVSGMRQIQKISLDTSIQVLSICADYFMDKPLFTEDSRESENILNILIENASIIGVKEIVLPMVDQSSLKTDAQKNKIIHLLKSKESMLADKKINISLETDLAPDDFGKLLFEINSPHVKVNYDIGNSASLGFNPEEEFKIYGHFISDVHIKDRVLRGGSVALGTGNAQIEKCFQLLSAQKYNGLMVMQAFRPVPYLEDLMLFKQQLIFSQSLHRKYFN